MEPVTALVWAPNVLREGVLPRGHRPPPPDLQDPPTHSGFPSAPHAPDTDGGGPFMQMKQSHSYTDTSSSNGSSNKHSVSTYCVLAVRHTEM